MGSYHRKCNKCGQLIQMRQMPQGQWVAFEGYDTLHDCNKVQTKRANSPVQASPHTDTLQVKQRRVMDEVQHPQDITLLLNKAIEHHNVATIHYDSKGFRKTTRDIEPLSSNGTYCHAYCRLRQDFRTFRISRITNISVHKEIFEPREVPAAPVSSRYSQDNYPTRRSGPVIPAWLWWVIGLIILWWLSRKH